jgi:hypothetical protein
MMRVWLYHMVYDRRRWKTSGGRLLPLQPGHLLEGPGGDLAPIEHLAVSMWLCHMLVDLVDVFFRYSPVTL